MKDESELLEKAEIESRKSWERMHNLRHEIERVAVGYIRHDDLTLIRSVFYHMVGELALRQARICGRTD